MIDDVLVGREDAVREPVIAHELPDIFDRVEFRAFWRQRNDADIRWHFQLVARVPAGLIHQQHAVRTRFDGARYLGQMQRHGFGIAERQDQPGTLAMRRADGTEDVGRLGALVLGR